MTAVRFPPGYRIEPLRRDHPKSAFHSGQAQVDDWLANKALQNQEKHLSATKVLIDPVGDHCRVLYARYRPSRFCRLAAGALPTPAAAQSTGCRPGLAWRSRRRSGPGPRAPPARPGTEGLLRRRADLPLRRRAPRLHRRQGAEVLPALGFPPAAGPQLPTLSELETAPGHGDGLLTDARDPEWMVRVDHIAAGSRLGPTCAEKRIASADARNAPPRQGWSPA